MIKQRDSFTIIVSDAREERKRLTIARELGRLFLNLKYQIDENVWANTKNKVHYNDDESMVDDVDRFAVTFLMPGNEFKIVLEEKTEIDKIADYFGVPNEVAHTRAIQLKLLK